MSLLNFLIHDCLREYSNDYIPSTVDESIAQSTQIVKCIDVPLLLEWNLFSFQYKNVVSPVIAMPSPVPSTHTLSGLESMESPSTVSTVESPVEAPNDQFICLQCNKSYLGAKQLSRHQKKHDTPDKYSCPFVGCKMKTYRLDGMRSHVRCHERRILKEEQALQDSKI
jgi:uncharacterized Zn-finger protein